MGVFSPKEWQNGVSERASKINVPAPFDLVVKTHLLGVQDKKEVILTRGAKLSRMTKKSICASGVVITS